MPALLHGPETIEEQGGTLLLHQNHRGWEEHGAAGLGQAGFPPVCLFGMLLGDFSAFLSSSSLVSLYGLLGEVPDQGGKP